MSDGHRADKRITVIGVSDEETAHLRLLMRKAEGELSHRWRWSGESGADLLIVDPSSFAGQMARTRATSGGMRCAIFSDEAIPGNDLVLQRPLKLANVIAVLNQTADVAVQAEGIVSQKQDFYFREIGDDELPADVPVLEEEAIAPRPARESAPSLDELLRVDPADAKEVTRIKASLDDSTTVFGTAGPTARSEARERDVPDSFARSRTRLSQGPTFARNDIGPANAGTARNTLRAYLEGDQLGGPSRIVLPGAPALVLDPKLRVFHSAARLAELEPYCRTALPPKNWEPLTGAELAEVRIAEPAQPYLRLIWLYVLVHSDGKLARHLDPGGTYRLARWIEIERDFSAYFRIASTMLQPVRLHELAAASGASMVDVFNVVNAYDAVGLIECQPRAPRDGETASPPPGTLLQRLRKGFRKP